MDYKFKRAIVGGTFDHLHAGHQSLLTTAFTQTEHVIIGLATNGLFAHKLYASLIEDFATRKAAIERFLEEYNFIKRAEIVPITDFYGTSLTDKTLEAIFITESNAANVVLMNNERAKKGFSPLVPVVVPYVVGNSGEVITSQGIRKGATDRAGQVYLTPMQMQNQFDLPQEERESLRIPLGEIFTDMGDVLTRYRTSTMLIAVGDVVAHALLEKEFQAAISIVDGKTRREELVEGIELLSHHAKRWETTNKAGTIAKEAVTRLQATLDAYRQTNEKQLMVVSGEEDLLAIPAIILAPLQSVILYGLFGQGIVAVEVSEQKKQDVYDLFRKFQ